jgi:hypothetical protein
MRSLVVRLTLVLFSITVTFNIIQYATVKDHLNIEQIERITFKRFQKKVLKLARMNFKEFCVIAAVYNPASFESRYSSYLQFKKHMSSFGVYLITIELAIGNQTFQVTQANHPRHLQFKTDDILWYKENLINIGIKRSPDHCKYIAWIDLEVEFLNRNWVRETMTELQHNNAVQLFEIVKILGPHSEVLDTHKAYGWCFSRTRRSPKLKKKYKIQINSYCAPGYAWAAKKSTLMEIGGLFDKSILGDGYK